MLGPALAWARREGVVSLDVVVDSPAVAGVLARRAACFAAPPQVWLGGWRAEPAPPSVASVDVDLSLAPLIEEAGAEPVIEHGTLYGEVLGLEVCRVVDGRLEVGVGEHDREAQQLVHAGRPPEKALRFAVETVRANRPVDLAASRWLRGVVVRRPELVGFDRLEPVAPPLPRRDLRDLVAAAAMGDGAVVVCSAGIDLDLVPTAADARLMHAPDARLVLVVAERDDHPVTRALAAALAQPADVVTVPDDWRALP